MAVLNSMHGEGWNRQAPITAATPPPIQEEQVAPITATMPPPVQEGQVAPITAATPSLVQEEQRAQETAVADDGDGQTIIAGEDIDLNIQLLFLSSEANTDIEFQLKNQIADNSLTDAELKAYLEKNGITPIKDKMNVEKFKKMVR